MSLFGELSVQFPPVMVPPLQAYKPLPVPCVTARKRTELHLGTHKHPTIIRPDPI